VYFHKGRTLVSPGVLEPAGGYFCESGLAFEADRDPRQLGEAVYRSFDLASEFAPSDGFAGSSYPRSHSRSVGGIL
jgi:hypothetical protein